MLLVVFFLLTTRVSQYYHFDHFHVERIYLDTFSPCFESPWLPPWCHVMAACSMNVWSMFKISAKFREIRWFRPPPKFKNFGNNNLNIFKSIFKNSLKMNFGRNFVKFREIRWFRPCPNFFSNEFQNPGYNQSYLVNNDGSRAVCRPVGMVAAMARQLRHCEQTSDELDAWRRKQAPYKKKEKKAIDA